MAGKYIEILNPGYSTLWTRDLQYSPGSGEAADINPFNPNDDRPLVEGEWLQYSTTAAGRTVTRGGNNAMSVSGTVDGEGSAPAWMYFLEQGRTDAQATKRTHIIMGPFGFEFRVRTLCDSTGVAVNDLMSVWDWDGPAGAWGVVRRVLAKKVTSSNFTVGRVLRVYGTNDLGIVFMPGTA
jgi:hypothetical protein